MKKLNHYFEAARFQNAPFKIGLLFLVCTALAAFSLKNVNGHFYNSEPERYLLDVVACPIDSITTWHISGCYNNDTDVYTDDWYTIDYIVHFSGDSLPSTGHLRISGPDFINPDSVDVGTLSGLDSFIFQDVPMWATGWQSQPIEVTATFTVDPTCTLTNTNAGFWWPDGHGGFFQVKSRKQCSVCPPGGTTSPPSVPAPSCWPEEDPALITSHCDISANNGPDPDFPKHTPIRYIKTVLHIFQKEDPDSLGRHIVDPAGPGNFDSTHMGIIQSWFTEPDGVNYQLSNLCPDSLSSSPTMTDTRIRMINDGIHGHDVFFHPDNNAWGAGYGGTGSFPTNKYITSPDSTFLPPRYYASLKSDSIPFKYTLTEDDLSEHTQFVNLTNIIIGKMQSGTHYTSYDSLTVTQVQAVADNSSGLAGTMAKGLLNVFYGYTYWLNTASPPIAMQGYRVPSFGGQAANATTFKQNIKALPNPVQDRVTFYFDFDSYDAIAELEIYDVNGKLVKTFTLQGKSGSVEWNTTSVPRGMYYCRTNIGGTLGRPLKLVLIE